MTHIPTKFDIITDLKRSLYSSYSDLLFNDENTILFLNKAEKNLEVLKDQMDKGIYVLVKKRIEKAKNDKHLVEKRREDLLTASCLLY